MTEEEDNGMDTEYVFDFTHQDSEPVHLLSEPGPGHVPTILAHGNERLLVTRYHRLAD